MSAGHPAFVDRRKTNTAARVLAFVGRYAKRHGYPPSIREIQKACSIESSSTVHYHLLALERAGKITRRDGLNRAIAVVTVAPRPNAGRVAAAVRRLRRERA